MRRLLLILLGLMSLNAVAAPDYCTELTGAWSGTYHDTEGLFLNQDFPINLVILYQAGHFYGYSLPAADQAGAGLGASTPAYIWGDCQNNTVSQVYLLPPSKNCTSVETQSSTLISTRAFNFNAHFENAMANTTFNITLKRVNMQSKLNTGLIQYAKSLSQENISTCH